MPELPEVETIRRDAAVHLTGRRVRGVSHLAPAVLRAPAPDAFRVRLAGAAFQGARRLGKYLLLDLDTGDTLGLQLALFGQLLLLAGSVARDPDTLLVLDLEGDATVQLRDRTAYSRVALGTPEALAAVLKLDGLGPDPSEPVFSAAELASRLGRRRARLKGLLLDQQVLAGLGNIYVDEALWAARLHPARSAESLTDEEVAALHAAIRDVLLAAVADRGTTFHTYRDLLGVKGRHQDALAVFHRQGQPCPRCGTPIVRSKVASRDTHLCPGCQAIPDSSG